MIHNALDGLRVLDLTHYVAGPYGTRLLADLGADVIKVERPGGDGSRAMGPFPADVPDPERSGLFLCLNVGKRSIEVDLKTEGGRETFLELVRWADLLVENFRPRVMPSLGLDYVTLSEVNPDLVMVSVSDFGQTGPYRDYQGSEIVDYALGGPMHVTGLPDRNPLKLGGQVVQYLAGVHAAAAGMVAVLGRLKGRGGDHVDISIMETQMGSPDRRTPMLVGYQYTGQTNKRGTVGVSPQRPCMDGYINLYLVPKYLDRAARMLGRPELANDPRFNDPLEARKPENAAEFEAIVMDWLMSRTMVQAWREAQEAKVLSGPLYSFADLLKDPHFIERGFWEEIDHPRAGRLKYPGRPLLTPGAPAPPRRPAPLLNQHQKDVVEMLRHPQQTGRDAHPSTPDRRGGLPLPLAGVRVVDLTVVLAGSNATSLLADWGAEVIRVEPLRSFLPGTRSSNPRITKQLVEANPTWLVAFPDWDPGPRPWNVWPHFQAHGRNKLSMTLDLTQREGRDLFLELVSVSDVMIENNVPETIEKLGLEYETLRKVKPDLVMVRMPAYGLSGPYKNYRSLGAHLEGTAGHTLLRGYPDTDPSMTEDVYLGDAAAAVSGAFAAASALWQLGRTGKGSLVEVCQTETLISFFGEYILDYEMNGRLRTQMGNDMEPMAPHNTYPTSGEDQWVAIAVGTDEQWRALVAAMNNPSWAANSRFATQRQRFANRAELDEHVGRWTRGHENRWVAETLQKVGVPAGALNDERDAYEDPHLRARGFFEEITHAEAGTHRYPGIIWKMARTPNAIRLPPCLLGEHNDYVYRELLGLNEERYREMEEAGHIGMDYAPDIE